MLRLGKPLKLKNWSKYTLNFKAFTILNITFKNECIAESLDRKILQILGILQRRLKDYRGHNG